MRLASAAASLSRNSLQRPSQPIRRDESSALELSRRITGERGAMITHPGLRDSSGAAYCGGETVQIRLNNAAQKNNNVQQQRNTEVNIHNRYQS
ncbi:uncharacterized protein V6R79_013116 [Siganus canaliculatus]